MEQTLYKLEQICLLAVVQVREVWNECYCPRVIHEGTSVCSVRGEFYS